MRNLFNYTGTTSDPFISFFNKNQNLLKTIIKTGKEKSRFFLPLIAYLFIFSSLSAQSPTLALVNPSGDTVEKAGVDCPEPCPCKGGYVEIKVYYFGEDNVDINVYGNVGLTSFITSFAGVNKGDLLVIDGSALPSGKLFTKTYLEITNALGESCVTKFHTRCPTNSWPGALEDLQIVGQTIGDFVVFSATDEFNNNECTISDVNQDWHVGGNVVGVVNNTMGTRNNEDVVFISNDSPRGVITKTGDYGINTATPAARLDVQGDVIIEETLDVNGIARMNSGDASSSPATGALIVTGGVGVSENLNVGNDAEIGNNLDVGNDATVGNDLNVGHDASVVNDAAVGHDLDVGNNADVINNLSVGNDASVGRDLDVNDDGFFGGNLRVSSSPAIRLDLDADASGNSFTSNGADLFLRSGSNDLFINSLFGDGKVAIGTTNVPDDLGGLDISGYNLYVEGGILADEIRVRTGWADYVFAENYNLPSLEEVALFINKHKHLPDTPTANDIESGGLDLAEATVLQQEKIEELFLYLIELNATVKTLQSENEALQIKVAQLEKQ
jgi:carbonic anhydrase/acetyltransferase-like protein (isoleucine patch superfamily)